MNNTRPLVAKEEIASYIPQKPPVVMIDTLDFCEGAVTKTSFEIKEDTIFVCDGLFREPGIVENIAQTAAVKAGYEARKLGKDPQLGFIGAIKNLTIHRLPHVHEVLETSIEIINEVMEVTIIKGTSSISGKPVAECEMKIFIQKGENGQ